MKLALPSIVAHPQLEKMCELVRRLPAGGDFAEVGVYQGGSASLLYEIALASGRKLHLFDTFSGTPYFTPGLDHHKIDGEFAAPSAEHNIRSLMPAAVLHVGIYPETHPNDLGPLAFIHCDCDQYQSYKAVIGKMWPLVIPGGVMVFDDYPYLAGAKRAVEEHFSPAELKTVGQRNYVVKNG